MPSLPHARHRGSLRQLTSEPASFRGLEFTPGSQEIIFSSNGRSAVFRLYRIRIGDRNPQPRVIMEAGHGAVTPSLSRRLTGAGAKLAYKLELRDVNIWRWTNPALGSKPDPLTNSNEFEMSPDFSPDGKRLAFCSTRSGSHEIWIANADGTYPIQITSFRGGMVDAPRWAPDSKNIVFTAPAGSNRYVFVASASGGAPRRVSTDRQAVDEGRPSFSRDGRWIYFRSGRGGSHQIWKVPASQPSEPSQVTRGGGYEGIQAADGRLFYVRDRLDAGMFVVPADGGNEVLVLPDVRLSFWDMADSGVYYISRPNRWSGGEIRHDHLDTGKVSTVATIPAPSELIWSGFGVTSDGRTIAWTQMDRDDSDIMLIENFR